MAGANLHKLLFPLLLALVIMAVAINADYGEGKPESGDLAAMADAIKYLQGLDKVYGQAARPRQEAVSAARRSDAQQPTASASWSAYHYEDPHDDVDDGGGETLQSNPHPTRLLAGRSTRQAGLGHILGNLLHLTHLDKEYAARIRPRFGKRNFGHRLADKDEAQFLDV